MNVDMDDTEVGRVRAKLKKLMDNQEKSRIRPKSGIRYMTFVCLVLRFGGGWWWWWWW